MTSEMFKNRGIKCQHCAGTGRICLRCFC